MRMEMALNHADTDAPRPSSVFERVGKDDIRALIAAYPLAWVIARDGAGEASLLPLVGDYGADGTLERLIGHLARGNPLYDALLAAPRALLLFTGPQAYVSPEHAGRRSWAPTWNYAQIRIEAEIRFEDGQTDAALDLLIDRMEAGRADPWTAAELGARYDGMRRAIIGFTARVTRLQARFKLGQDEAPETLEAILGSLPDDAMIRWMRRLNGGRS